MSTSKDESESLIQQRKTVTDWASRNGHTVVGWAADDGVSGAVSPWKRAEFAPWLTDRVHEWDAMVSTKADRLTRTMGDMVRLVEWAETNRKAIVAIGDGLDSSGPMGPMPFFMIGMGADYELRRIKQRNRDSAAGHRVDGRNHGGDVLTGYRLVGSKQNLRLEPDPETADLVRSWVADILSGNSVNAVARSAGKTAVSMWSLMRNQTLWGVRTYRGEPLYQSDGQPIMALAPGAEPLISRDVFDQLQVALAARAGQKNRVAQQPLKVEIRCACELASGPIVGAYARLHKMQASGSVTRGRWLRCRTHGSDWKNQGNQKCQIKGVQLALVEQAITKLVDMLGQQPEIRREWQPGNGAELVRVEKQIKRLQSDRDLEVITEQAYAEQIKPLVARRKTLEASDSRDGGWSVVETGRTIAEAYRESGTLSGWSFLYDGEHVSAVMTWGDDSHGGAKSASVQIR